MLSLVDPDPGKEIEDLDPGGSGSTKLLPRISPEIFNCLSQKLKTLQAVPFPALDPLKFKKIILLY